MNLPSMPTGRATTPRSLDACLKLLGSGKLAAADVPRVAANAVFARQKLGEEGRLPAFPSFGRQDHHPASG